MRPAGDLGLRAADGSRAGVGAIARQLVVNRARRPTGREAHPRRRRRHRRVVHVERESRGAARGPRDGHAVRARRCTTSSCPDSVAGSSHSRLAFAALTIANSRATESDTRRARNDRERGPDPHGASGCRRRPLPSGSRRPRRARPARRAIRTGRSSASLGRIDPEKGIELVARAVARLPDPNGDAQLVIVGASLVGGNEYEESVRAEVARLLGERARFTGPTDDVPSVMRNLDVLVNASRAEPFGLTVLEAQACGVAVVAARPAASRSSSTTARTASSSIRRRDRPGPCPRTDARRHRVAQPPGRQRPRKRAREVDRSSGDARHRGVSIHWSIQWSIQWSIERRAQARARSSAVARRRKGRGHRHETVTGRPVRSRSDSAAFPGEHARARAGSRHDRAARLQRRELHRSRARLDPGADLHRVRAPDLDNGSTDRTREICLRYAARDARIRYSGRT